MTGENIVFPSNHEEATTSQRFAFEELLFKLEYEPRRTIYARTLSWYALVKEWRSQALESPFESVGIEPIAATYDLTGPAVRHRYRDLTSRLGRAKINPLVVGIPLKHNDPLRSEMIGKAVGMVPAGASNASVAELLGIPLNEIRSSRPRSGSGRQYSIQERQIPPDLTRQQLYTAVLGQLATEGKLGYTPVNTNDQPQ